MVIRMFVASANSLGYFEKLDSGGLSPPRQVVELAPNASFFGVTSSIFPHFRRQTKCINEIKQLR